MKSFHLLLAALIAIAAVNSASASEGYEAINNAIGTPGGIRFQNEVGLEYAVTVLETASNFFWNYFNQTLDVQRKNVTLIVLTVQNMGGGIVTNINNMIYMSADYIARYHGDVKTEFTGIVYHEVARVRQWDGGRFAPVGLLTGVADFFRLKAGYASATWGKPGSGVVWDEGYDVTALFLDYCNDKYPGFVTKLNALMKYGYSDVFFVKLTGKTVDVLWNDYKALYAGH